MSPEVLAGHHHVWQRGNGEDERTLLMLHGTGGDEHDLLPIAKAIAPGASVLSARGTVLENGMPRFFKRHAMGVLDVPDLKQRAGMLADFVAAAADEYGFNAEKVVAVGYSNGANVAAGVILTRPHVLAGAVLARAMVPFEPEDGEPPEPARAHVLLLPGRHDPYSQGPQTQKLAGILEGAGAKVDVRWAEAGHELTPADVQAARAWLLDAPEVRA